MQKKAIDSGKCWNFWVFGVIGQNSWEIVMFAILKRSQIKSTGYLIFQSSQKEKGKSCRLVQFQKNLFRFEKRTNTFLRWLYVNVTVRM